MLKTLLITLALIVICALLMAVKVLFVKGGKFPSMHAHDIDKLKNKK